MFGLRNVIKARGVVEHFTVFITAAVVVTTVRTMPNNNYINVFFKQLQKAKRSPATIAHMLEVVGYLRRNQRIPTLSKFFLVY